MKISISQYAKFLLEISQIKNKDVQKQLILALANFIKKNKHFKKSNKIIEKYNSLKKEAGGVVDVLVESFNDLDKKNLNIISEKIAKKMNSDPKKIKVSNQINKDILGGLIIKIGNEILDGSLKAKLERIKVALSS